MDCRQPHILIRVPRSKWGPDGNGTLDHENDLQWVFFHDVRIAADRVKGTYPANFSPTLARENGRTNTITGYMLPVEAPGHRRISC